MTDSTPQTSSDTTTIRPFPRVVLMKRLGYTRFVAQGGDWGAAVTQAMGVQAAPELTPEEKSAYEQLSSFFAKHVALCHERLPRRALSGPAELG